MGVLCNCLSGTLPKVIYLAQMIELNNQLWATAKQKPHRGCLAHVVSGIFYSVVANRRQPNLYKIGGGEGGY